MTWIEIAVPLVSSLGIGAACFALGSRSRESDIKACVSWIYQLQGKIMDLESDLGTATRAAKEADRSVHAAEARFQCLLTRNSLAREFAGEPMSKLMPEDIDFAFARADAWLAKRKGGDESPYR